MIKELIAKDIKSNKNQFAKIIKKGNRKYSLRLDNNTRKERLETLENIEENISGKLNKLKAKFEKYAPENVRIELSESKVELTEDQREGLKEIAELLKQEGSTEELQQQIFEVVKAKGKELFQTIYQVLIERKQGPRIAMLIDAIGREKVIERFERL